MIKLQPVLIFILFTACVFMYVRKPSGHNREIEMLEMDIKKRQKAIDSANQVIKLSIQREIALRLRSGLQDERIREVTQEANKNLKLYLNEKKRKTGILTDSLYTATIDSLYSR